MGCFSKLGPYGDCAQAIAGACEEDCRVARFYPMVIGMDEEDLDIGFLAFRFTPEATDVRIFVPECFDEMYNVEGGVFLIPVSEFICSDVHTVSILSCDEDDENCTTLCEFDFDIFRQRLPEGEYSFEIIPGEGCIIQVLLELNLSTSETEGTYTFTPIDDSIAGVAWLGEYCGGDLIRLYRIETTAV